MYEIPQQLEYKERIVFGLTFEQLAYAFLFFPIAILILFRLNINPYVRVFFALIPGSLAVGLMFLNFKEHIINWTIWFKYRTIDSQKKMYKFFEIKNIKDDLLITNNNKLAILKIESLNFQIKPENEQEAITLSFQKFLNSLDFPIQILMTTENLSIKEYVESLEERIKNKDSKDIFSEYKEHLDEIVSKNKILNRNFYIVIPEKTNLDIQIKICEDRLNSLNLKTKRLKTFEITKLLKHLFNSEDNVSLLPKIINNALDHVEIDDNLHRIIYAHSYPRSVETGFLDKLISCPGNFNFSLFIEPTNVETTLISVNKELQKQRADLYAAKLKGQLNPSLEIKYKDTRKTLEKLQKGQEKLFNISLYIDCKSDFKGDLDLLTRKIESELNSLLLIPRQAQFRMLQGFKSCLPLSENTLKINRNITTSGLSAFFPFTSQFFKFDKTGIWFGLGKNNIPIIRDIYKLSNANGICLASSGAGKSYLSKLFIARHILNGTKVMVIDPQGEYKGLVRRFKGQRIDLSRDSATIINPLDLMGHTYPEKRLALMDLMPIMLGDLTEPQKSFIDKAITQAYEDKDIYMNDPKSWNNPPPILEDILKILIKYERKATTLEKNTIRSLVNRLNLYVNGVFSFLNRHTQINFNNKFVCLDIGNLPKQVKPVMMFLVLDYVYTKMKADIERKLLVVDEAWSLLSRTEEASYIFEIVKTCRKFNLGLLLINQEVEDMLNSKAGKSVLANSSYTILLKQKPAVINNIQKTFHLSNSEKTSLLTSLVGEGILIIEDEHSPIKIIASKKEHEIITTNADEILKNNNGEEIEIEEEPPKQNDEVKIALDESKRVVRSKELSKKDIDYYKFKGFKEYVSKSILTNKREKYLVKPRSNEGVQHCFMVYDIANYLKKFTDKIYLYETKKPDIVFKIKDKVYAIEVETGKAFHDKKKFMNKVRLLNQTYGKNWFFMMTDKNLTPSYFKFGHTCDERTIKGKLKKIAKSCQ